MKDQVTNQTVKDLIHSTHRTSEWTLKILQAMKIGMPMLDEDKEDEAIEKQEGEANALAKEWGF